MRDVDKNICHLSVSRRKKTFGRRVMLFLGGVVLLLGFAVCAQATVTVLTITIDLYLPKNASPLHVSSNDKDFILSIVAIVLSAGASIYSLVSACSLLRKSLSRST